MTKIIKEILLEVTCRVEIYLSIAVQIEKFRAIHSDGKFFAHNVFLEAFDAIA